MNKKVLTLCASFLLAGSMSAFGQTFADVTNGNAHDGKYYHVFVQQGTNANPASSLLLTEKQETGVFAIAQAGNLDKREYMWTISVTPAQNGQPARYNLINAVSGDPFSINVSGVTYSGFVDPTGTQYDDELWFVEGATNTTWIGFKGTDAATTNSSADVFNYALVEVTPTDVTASDLNKLYNSTGFNLALNNADWADVENIFDNGQRVRALNVNGVNSTTSSGYGYPAGTYFVVSAPAGDYDELTDPAEQMSYLENCTFIAVAPVMNDINDEDWRAAGQGFQLTTVQGKDLNKYVADTDKTAMSRGSEISVVNACFTVKKDIAGNYAIGLDRFRYNENRADQVLPNQEQSEIDEVNGTDVVTYLTVQEKDGEDNDDIYLVTWDTTAHFDFAYEDAATEVATDWLNENAMAVYNVQFVNNQAIEGMYLYGPAYGNKAYAKGARFVDLNTPETQFIITAVDEDDNSITFTNRANRDLSLKVKLYEEADGVYSIAVDPSEQGNDDVYPVTVNEAGDLDVAATPLDIHGQWARITPATVDKFAGAWDVDNFTEVTMLFARDNTPTSNKLYVHVDSENGVALNVSNKLSEALQFQLVKDQNPTYLTNNYVYKTVSGENVAVNNRLYGDTIAYYTYKLQAYKDGQPQKDKFLGWNSTASGGGDYHLNATGDNFIIKDNVDGSVQILRLADPDDKAAGYDRTVFVVVKDWELADNATSIPSISDYNENHIVNGDLEKTLELKANDVKTYLEISSPEVTLDPETAYATVQSEMGDYITMQDSRDAIVVASEPMTFRLYATDTDRQVPSFYLTTGWDGETGARMFLFNPTDSVDYYVAEGDYDKDYEWGEGLTKAIFHEATLTESASRDTLFTNIKGENVAVSNVADNNKNVQAGLNRFKFQIVLAEDEDDLYWIRQDGVYLTSVNDKLAFDNNPGARSRALKVRIADTTSPTANESINAASEAVKVIATNGGVIVKGAEGKNVIVSTILGKVVANETLNSDNETIAAPAGIVVVSVDGESFKVAVK